ncbi:hypothetical protein [uncultured Roseibium sp.]|uniref:hypothetical protein n=1 Tax=uncultured Roseibium sp. TaxID=1936171 RepID=UPI002620C816|nr:hypothetical protein [uncultured Roseibium sp.]
MQLEIPTVEEAVMAAAMKSDRDLYDFLADPLRFVEEHGLELDPDVAEKVTASCPTHDGNLEHPGTVAAWPAAVSAVSSAVSAVAASVAAAVAVSAAMSVDADHMSMSQMAQTR